MLRAIAASTILRVAVVTILGLIGTIGTGTFGMNVFDEATRRFRRRSVARPARRRG